MYEGYVKVIGLKFDVLKGLEIVTDFNDGNFKDAGARIDKNKDDNMIFVGIPCSCKIN